MLTHLYDRIARILAIGFWTSIAVILAGVLLGVVQGEQISEETLAIRDVIPSVLDLEPDGLVDLGILLLLLTPLCYVIAAVITFLRQRDRLFVGVCLLLMLLIFTSVGLALV
jgi:uncharacterized membrane protein